MMVKNESKYLEQCLRSLQPLRDAIESELIIVDTGSTDSTVEIAKKFTDKVYFHKWNDDFSAMRNITISYAKGEWFFVIDGDEVLEGAEQIVAFLQSEVEKNYNAAAIYVKNFTNSKDWSKFSLITSARLFKRNEDFRYEGTVHNQPVFSGDYIRINSVLLHYGYISNDKELMERKFERTKEILERELDKDPENIYYLYQLSVTYAMHKEYEKALYFIDKAYQLIKDKNLDLKQYMYIFTNKAMFHQNLRDILNVEKICREAINVGREYLDIYFLLAESLFHQEKKNESLQHYEKYTRMVEDYGHNPKDPGVIDYTLSQVDRAYSTMCGLYYEKGDIAQALVTVLKIKDESILAEAFKRIIDLHVELKQYNELALYYKQIILVEHPKLQSIFENDMEFMRQYWNPIEEESVAEAFAGLDVEYGFYHYVWLANRGKEAEVVSMPKITFKGKPEFYGEIIYWCLEDGDGREPLTALLSTTAEEQWNQFVSYAYKTFENKFFERIVKFVGDSKNVNRVFDCQLAKAFARYALLFSLTNSSLRKEMLTLYLRYGCEYVEKLYRPEIIRQEKCDWFSNAEDSFFIMTWRAKRLLRKKREEQFIEATKEILQKTPQLRSWCNFMEWKQALSEI